MPNLDLSKSDWNFAKADEIRFSQIIYIIDELTFRFYWGDYNCITRLWASLKVLWDEWRARIKIPDQEKIKELISQGELPARFQIDNHFNQCKRLISKYEQDLITNKEFTNLVQYVEYLVQLIKQLKYDLGFTAKSEEDEDFDDEEVKPITELDGKPVKLYKL